MNTPPPPCEVRQVFLLQREPEIDPSFAVEPIVRSLSREGAAMDLLRHTLNRAAGTALYRQYGEHPHLKAYGEIYATLAEARCFRLTAGAPDATASLIHQIASEDGPASSESSSRPAAGSRA